MSDFASAQELPDLAYRAWLLDIGGDIQVAVAHHEMSRVLLSPPLFDVPLTPRHCHQVIIDGDDIYPVIDLAALLTGHATDFSNTEQTQTRFIGLAVYQKIPGEPLEYAGIHLQDTPAIISVNDSQACELPTEQSAWTNIALSCFSYQNKAVPILDLPTLFSETLRKIA